METLTLNGITYVAKSPRSHRTIEGVNYGACDECEFKLNWEACGNAAMIIPCSGLIRHDQRCIIWVKQNEAS